MTNTLLQDGLDFAADSLPQVAGGKVRYGRGDDGVILSAAFGRTDFQIEDAEGMRLVRSDRDFLLRRDKLLLGGVFATPTRGDQVTLIDPLGRFGDVFEVVAPAGFDVYAADATGTMLRIHAKKLR